jgi:ribosomal-protein-alanine N-acetyltransferase
LNALAIREAVAFDLDTVELLEQAIFPHPWSRGMLADELRGDPQRISLLALEGDVPVGFAFCWRVVDELHLINLGVLPSHRRRGVAGAIFEALLAHPRAEGAAIVTLEVRATNLAAQRFYQRNGFREIAMRPRYYPDTREDALIMLKSLTSPMGEDPE